MERGRVDGLPDRQRGRALQRRVVRAGRVALPRRRRLARAARGRSSRELADRPVPAAAADGAAGWG